MTLEELEDSLPNGLHDAEIQRICIDYQQRTVTIDMAVFVGDVDAPLEKREAYRDGSLVISGLQFATIEPPDARYPFSTPGASRVDACDMTKNLDPSLLQVLPEGSFVRSFFVDDWNAFVHIAGSGAEIQWKAPVVYRKDREHYLPGEIVDL
ncbi:MAG: hypothetical protein LAO22_04095 [Acidobacteriia bacterium]|nr:hypothetical protein [Terriglobia bacterium]